MGSADYCRSRFIEAGGDKVRSGLLVTFFAGLTVRLSLGAGVVGGVAYENTASVDFTSDLESSANPRIDMLVARKKADLTVEFAIRKGNPAATPLMPALVQSHSGVWEFGLGYWTVPGNNVGTIVGGSVARHNFEFAEVITPLAPDNPPPTIAPGQSVFIKSTSFKVPGPVKVCAEAWVDLECPVGQAAAGTVLIECGGKSFAQPWKSVNGGSKQVSVELGKVGDLFIAFAGTVQANLSVTAEGLSQPVTVSRYTTRLRQWT